MSIGDPWTSVYNPRFSLCELATPTQGERLTPSASIMVILWPSIQKKNAENALVLMIRSRYVFPGSKGIVAFSLNPTWEVTEDGFVPVIGAR